MRFLAAALSIIYCWHVFYGFKSLSVEQDMRVSTFPGARLLAEPPDRFSLEERRQGALALHFVGLLYMFMAIAIVCDECFVPALEVIVEVFDLSPDVAGASFMAAGGSAPEFFTSMAGAIVTENDIGTGTIIGSAVFNVLFVIGACAVAAPEPLQLTWFPLARDSLFYAVDLMVVVCVFLDEQVYWWEALVLFFLYVVYMLFMKNNGRIEAWACRGNTPSIPDDEVDAVKAKDAWSGSDGNGNDTAAVDDAGSAANGGTASLAEAPAPAQSAAGLMTQRTNTRTSTRSTHSVGVGEGCQEVRRFRHKSVRHTSGTDGRFLTEDSLPSRNSIGFGVDAEGRPRRRKSTPVDMPPTPPSAVPAPSGDAPWLPGSDCNSGFGGVLMAGAAPTGAIANPAAANGSVAFSAVVPSVPAPDSPTSSTQPGPAVTQAGLLIAADSVAAHAGEGEALAKKDAHGKQQDCECISHGSAATATASAFNGGGGGQEANGEVGAETAPGEPEDDEEEEPNEPLSLALPSKDAGCQDWGWYVVKFPIVFVLVMTVPDVRRDGYAKYYAVTFATSILWIAGFTWVMVWFATVIAETCGLSEVIMGLTILAAGTSVPDLITSMLVARDGFGDMAVSSSIGSNIFDVTVGLPVPWLVFAMVRNGQPVKIKNEGLEISVMLLLAMLGFTIGSVMFFGWKMTRSMGASLLVLYLVFEVVSVSLTFAPEGSLKLIHV